MKRNLKSSSSLIYHHHHHRCHRHHKIPSVTTLVLCSRSLDPVSRCPAQLLVATCIIRNSCSTNQTISCNLPFKISKTKTNSSPTNHILQLALSATVAQQSKPYLVTWIICKCIYIIIYLKLKLTVAQQTISCNLNYPQLSDDSCHLPTKPYLDGGVGGHRYR